MSILERAQSHLIVTAPRRPSPQIIQFVKSFETCAKRTAPGELWFKAYKPTPDDVWTCGWGTTKGVTEWTLWSQSRCDAAFEADCDEFSLGVDRLTRTHPINQAQFDALFSMAYNCGLVALKDSTLLKRHLAGFYAEAADQFPRWNKQKGKVLAGLTRRRNMERAIYLGDTEGYRGNV